MKKEEIQKNLDAILAGDVLGVIKTLQNYSAMNQDTSDFNQQAFEFLSGHQDNIYANFFIATMHHSGWVPQPNFKIAHQLYQKVADKIPLAFNSLGVLYMDGLGVKRDYATAKKFFLKASEAKIPLAQYNLGYIFLEGLGVEKDIKEAKKWFILSADAGLDVSQYTLGQLSEQEGNLPEAIKWLTLASDQDNVDALCLLGRIKAREPLGPNSREAFELFFRATILLHGDKLPIEACGKLMGMVSEAATTIALQQTHSLRNELQTANQTIEHLNATIKKLSTQNERLTKQLQEKKSRGKILKISELVIQQGSWKPQAEAKTETGPTKIPAEDNQSKIAKETILQEKLTRDPEIPQLI